MTLGDRWLPWVTSVLVAYTGVHFLFSGILTPVRHGHGGDFIAALREWWDPATGVYYGPLFSWIEFVTRHWERSTILWVFFGLNFVFIGVAWLLSLQVWYADRMRPSSQVWAWHGIIWFNFYPLYRLIGETSIELFELMLMNLAFWFWLRARPLAAGIASGLATMTKFLPGAALPYFWVRRERLICGAMLATMAAVSGITMWAKDLTLLQLFSPLMHPPQIASNFDNQSLAGFAYRLFSHMDWVSDPVVWNAPAARLVGLVLRTAGIAIALWWAWRWGKVTLPAEEHRLRLGVEYMGLMTTVLLVAPHNHAHYFGLILPAYTVLLVSWLRRPHLWSRRLLWSALASYLLMGYVVPLSLLDRWLPPVAPVPYIHVFKLLSLPLLGACLLWVVLGTMLQRLANPVPSHELYVTS